MIDLTHLTQQTTTAGVATAAVDLGLAVVLAGIPSTSTDTEKAPLRRPGAARGGIYSATSSPLEARRWLLTCTGTPVNCGVRTGCSLPGGGTLAIVDMDTPAARQAFSALCSDHGSGTPDPAVLSPGGVSPTTGRWEHWAGAHVYLRIPDGTLPENIAGTVALTDGSAASAVEVKVHSSWAMMPPSTRREGSYRWGPAPTIWDAPAWLVQRIIDAGRPTSRRERRDSEFWVSETRAAWDAETPWSSILPDAGWTEDRRTASCGCQLWNRPRYSVPGSGVAHEGCEHGYWLHLHTAARGGDPVTDAAGAYGRSQVSKVEAAASVRYPEEPAMADRVRALLTAEGLREGPDLAGLDLGAHMRELNRTPRTPPAPATGMPMRFGATS
ncbi:bifunctional DNA primase/polymerase [Corynebacterium sp. USCH3]|uniref:bifunctional DNA primase/polymerase n=1 Tax=Corynebacterium sp. USCH3 TaxID=3024840 RepID=UPI0030B75AAD